MQTENAATTATASRSKRALGRLMQQEVAPPFLDQAIRADIYLRNGFRLAGVAADASDDVLQRASNRLRTLLRAGPHRAARMQVRTGYEDAVDLEALDIQQCLRALGDPRARLLAEVFWPHHDGGFPVMQQHLSLAAPEVKQSLGATNGKPTSALQQHASAVVLHSEAIGREVRTYERGGVPDGEVWAAALAAWTKVCKGSDFWTYLEKRMRAVGDPRVTNGGVEEIRKRMPGILLGFHVLWARAYADQGRQDACIAHMKMVRKSPFAVDGVADAAVADLVRGLVAAKMGPLVTQAQSQLVEAKDLPLDRFSRLCDPILAQATELLDLLRKDLELPEELIQNAADFGALCGAIRNALNTSLDWSGPQRAQALAYSYLTMDGLLQFPIQEALRDRIRSSIRKDLEIIYDKYLTAGGQVDPTRCWFMDGQKADAQASLTFPLFKITKVQPSGVSYTRLPMVIPRSAHAAAIHDGRLALVDPATLEDQYLDATGRQKRDELIQLRDQAKRIEREIKGREQQQTEALERQREQAEAAIQQARAADIQAVEQSLAAVNARVSRRRSALCASRDQELARLNQHFGPQVQSKQAEAAKHSHAALPAALSTSLGGAAMALMQNWLCSSLLLTDGLRWQLANIPPIVVAFAGASLTLAVVLLWIRRRRGPEYAELRALQSEWEDAVASAQQKCEQEIAELEHSAAQERAPHQAKAEEIQAQINAAKAPIIRRIHAVHAQTASELAAKVEPLMRRAQAIEQELRKKLQARPKAYAKQFPPYRAALADGFQDGDGPGRSRSSDLSNRELRRLLDSLNQSERMMLALLQDRMPRQQFGELLDRLAEAPSYERHGILMDPLRPYL